MPKMPEFIRGVHEGGGIPDPQKENAKPELTVIEGGHSDADREQAIKDASETRIYRAFNKWYEGAREWFGRKEIADQYQEQSSKPPRADLLEAKDSEISYIDYHATISAYGALASLERERASGQYPNGEKAFADGDAVIVSWLEDELEEGGPREFNGIIERSKLAEVLKEGLSMTNLEERRKLAIQVADSGPRCILYPFLHRIDYIDPVAFGGKREDLTDEEKVRSINDNDEPLVKQFKTIKKEGHSVKSERVVPYTQSPYIIMDVEKIMQGRKLGKYDEEYYTKLLQPWGRKQDAEEKGADMPLAA